MDIILKNLVWFCINLSNKSNKCHYYVSQLPDQLNYGKNAIGNNLIEILSVIFFFFLFFFFYIIGISNIIK